MLFFQFRLTQKIETGISLDFIEKNGSSTHEDLNSQKRLGFSTLKDHFKFNLYILLF